MLWFILNCYDLRDDLKAIEIVILDYLDYNNCDCGITIDHSISLNSITQ